MKNKLVKNGKSTEQKLTQYVPYLAVMAVAVVSYFVLFHTGLGSINSAQAQVNPGRVGEVVVDQVTEAAAETEAEISETIQEIDDPGSTEEEIDLEEELGEEIPMDIPLEELEKMYEEYTGEGSAYYTSREGLGGQNVVELSQAELYQHLLGLSEIGGNPMIAELAMPIMTRFQTMVSPPAEIGEDTPWLSGERRYSPFDVIGAGPPPNRNFGAGPTSPFLNPMGNVLVEIPDVLASDVARALKLTGVMGEEGGYFAIINVQGNEETFHVGDIIGPYMERNFEVTEITLDAVKIVDTIDPSNTGIIQFVQRESSGIEFSISG